MVGDVTCLLVRLVNCINALLAFFGVFFGVLPFLCLFLCLFSFSFCCFVSFVLSLFCLFHRVSSVSVRLSCFFETEFRQISVTSMNREESEKRRDRRRGSRLVAVRRETVFLSYERPLRHTAFGLLSVQLLSSHFDR